MSATPTPDRALAAIARRNRGMFTIADAVRCGFTYGMISRRRDSGLWVEVAPRVLRSAAAGRLAWVDEVAAQTLSQHALAVFESAGALYGQCDPPATPEVLVVRSRRGGSRHSTRALPPGDIAIVQDVRATAPARTIIDLCGRFSRDHAAELVDRAITQRLVRATTLERRARELWTPARRGCAVVLSLLAEAHPELARARSAWEAALLRACAQAGLPQPSVNVDVQIGGHRYCLDLAWVAERVVVEFDGYEVHSGRIAFDNDRERQNLLVGAGWLVFRLTSTALRRGARQALDPVMAALVGRRSSPLVDGFAHP